MDLFAPSIHSVAQSLPAHAILPCVTYAVVRRSTRTMCREGRVAVRCLPRYVRGGSKYCVNSHGRKCMGRIYTDTRGRGVPIMRCQPYYATIILRAEIRRSGREQSLLPFRFARIQKRLAFLRRFVLDFVHFPAAPLWTRFTDTVFPRWIVGYRLGWLPPCFVPSVIRNRNLHQSRRADGLPCYPLIG